jgi:hypothetical protein
MTVQRAELHNLKNSSLNLIFEIVKFIAEVFVQERLLINKQLNKSHFNILIRISFDISKVFFINIFLVCPIWLPLFSLIFNCNS